LFIITGFLVSLHPPTAINLIIILTPYILFGIRGNFKHSVGIALVVLAPFLLPFPWIVNILLPTTKSLMNPQVIPTNVDILGIMQLYGYLPISMVLLGTSVLVLKGRKRDYGLVFGLLAILIMQAVFFSLR